MEKLARLILGGCGGIGSKAMDTLSKGKSS